MIKTYLLVASAAIALAACGEKRTDTATVETTRTTADNTATDVGNGMSDTTNDIGNSAPVNAAQDAVGGVVGQVSAATSNSVDAYVGNAAMGDMYAIMASKIAVAKSGSPAVKKFAQQMIDAHTGTTAGLKKIVATDNLVVTMPMKLDDRRQGFINNLNAATAANFDATYIDQQTAAHKEALTLQKSYIDDGDNAALKAFAVKISPAIQSHLDMVQKLDARG